MTAGNEGPVWVQAIFHKLAAHMSDLRGADFKIAFYLVSQVVATGNAEISLSERALSDGTGISLSTIRAALVRLEASGLFLREPGGYHRTDRFLLPAFRPPESGVPISDTQNGVGVPISDTQNGVCVPISDTQAPIGVPISDTQCIDFRYTEQPGVPISGTPPYKERAGAPVESSSFVGSSSSSIDSILLTKTLRPNQADEALVLRSYMRSFIERVADATLRDREIDDAIVAQCLAIAPAGRLIECLTELRSRHVPPFQTMGWFVTAFLKYFNGVPPSEVKARRGALRVVRRPVNTESQDDGFNRAVISQALNSVRGLG